ncbi:glycosyltransferase family 4 protein [Candidatus Omnitrophota bacterium]
MKLIFITREGYGLAGARIRCYHFCRELARYGIDSEVLSFADTLWAKDGIKESQLRIRDKFRLNYLAFKRIAKDKEAFLYIQRFNYHTFAPYLAGLLNKNRIILDLDDWEMRENPKYYLGFYPSSKAHFFTRQIAKKSIFCIASSRFLEQFLLQFNKKVFYIPSGVDTELFKPSLNGLPQDKVVFSWIGTLHKKEYIDNLEFALSCFSSLRKRCAQIYFEIAGDGIYKQDLEKIINRYNDQNVLLRDCIHPNAVPEYLANINIGLLPVASDTKFNRAKSPAKLFEYMAMAKPTVASGIGEAAYIIQDGDNGFLAKTKQEFTEKMQRLIEDSDLRQRMGQKARGTIENKYSLKVLGRQLYEILKKNA